MRRLKTLHKYLLRQIGATLILTVVVFTFVLLLGNGVKEMLPLLVSGKVRFTLIAEAFGLLIPFVLVFALPMGLLTATLLAFGRISADHELTAARASGVSLISLVSPILLLSLFCCGLSFWINTELGPACRVAYKKLTFEMRSEIASMQIPEGRYVRDIPGYIVYVEKVRGGELDNVTIISLKDATNVSMTLQADHASMALDDTKTNLVVTMTDWQRMTVTRSGRFRTDGARGPLSTRLSLPSTVDKNYRPKISDMTFYQLQDELRDLEQKLSVPPSATNSADMHAQLELLRKHRNDLTEPVRVEMHREVAFSFASFGFALVGIPLGIRVHRRETNIGVALALGLVLVYYMFVIVGESLSSRPEFFPHLILWIPNFIFQAVGGVLLWRANRGI